MKQYRARILSNKKIAPEHYRLSLGTPGTAGKSKPGQFFTVRVTGSYEPLLRRPFGVHRTGKKGIGILYKVVGTATDLLSKKKPGTYIDLIGPLGNGFTVGSPARASRITALLVAGGHGVAPLVALAKDLKARRVKCAAYIGARTKDHVVCDKDLKKLGARRVVVATEDGSRGHKGVITKPLEKHLASLHERTSTRASAKGGSASPARTGQLPGRAGGNQLTIYACGPKPMLKAVAALAKRYRIPCQVSLEEYIACGIGTCMGCAVKTKSGYKMVCKDGPVFEAREIVWR
jgi:dihydroorotate dehydrogenase electron transfer subunit